MSLPVKNMRRWLLLAGVTLAGTVALLSIGAVFVGSLRPGGNAGRDLPEFNISGLQAGSYLLQDFPTASKKVTDRILILKDYESNIHVYALRVHDDKIVMPGREWWRWEGLCQTFGPDVEGETIKRDGLLRCKDVDIGQWALAEWRWTYAGRNLGRNTADLHVPPHSVGYKSVIIGKSE